MAPRQSQQRSGAIIVAPSAAFAAAPLASISRPAPDTASVATDAPRPGPLARVRRYLVEPDTSSSGAATPRRRAGGLPKSPTGRTASVASASAAIADNVQNAVPMKPASDVVAGAVARAASQSTIHPIDTLKVRAQTYGLKGAITGGVRSVTTLYNGVAGAACGAGIALGAYFAFYGAACNLLSRRTKLPASSVAFIGGGAAAAGSSIVKVPLAVCIRSVQAGVYDNALVAAKEIVRACGPRGLFTGYAPTLIEDVPDMAFKFAVYEGLRAAHRRIAGGRRPAFAEDFAMGAVAGAFAAAATTPLDVIKTTMMCSAASRPTMASAAAQVHARGGAAAFFRGVTTRATSNGVNSAVFFCFFEALRKQLAERAAERSAAAALAADVDDACRAQRR